MEQNREEQVAVFHRLMNQPFGDNPKETSIKNIQLGIKLIFSELRELAEASGVAGTFQALCAEENLRPEQIDTGILNEVLQLDGLADVQYTTSWAINMFGHSKHFPAAFAEVCRSNNSKACKTPEEAEATKAYWENPENAEGGGEHYIDPVVIETGGETNEDYRAETYYVVKRCSDNKVRKARDYSKANFKQFLPVV